MKQTYCHRIDLCGIKRAHQTFDVVVQRDQNLSLCGHAFAHCKRTVARDQQIRFLKINVILGITPLVSDLQNVAKTFCRDRGHPCAAPLDQSVCCKRGAVNKSSHLLRPTPRSRHHARHALQSPVRRIEMRGQYFGGSEDVILSGHQYGVRKGSTDIDSQTQSVVLHGFVPV